MNPLKTELLLHVQYSTMEMIYTAKLPMKKSASPFSELNSSDTVLHTYKTYTVIIIQEAMCMYFATKGNRVHSSYILNGLRMLAKL